MIIKVPVYLEIPDIDQNLLPEVVETLGNITYRIIRKEDFKVKSTHWVKIPQRIRGDFSVQVLSKEQALEHLRTKK